jgi:hypothetical protein
MKELASVAPSTLLQLHIQANHRQLKCLHAVAAVYGPDFPRVAESHFVLALPFVRPDLLRSPERNDYLDCAALCAELEQAIGNCVHVPDTW